MTRELEALRDIVDDTLQGVRSFTSDLRPPLLSELGLARTLQLSGRPYRARGAFYRFGGHHGSEHSNSLPSWNSGFTVLPRRA